MTQELYSVDQVAERLGLHVKTVRHHIQGGKLRAVRIGKRYRILREDLEAFTGVPLSVAESTRRTRHVEVSSIVEIDAIDAPSASRITIGLNAALNAPRQGDARLRLYTRYDETRARLKLIITGSPDTTAQLLKMLTVYLDG